ncbi:peptidase M20 [Amylocystis lapponica]|nr:peptidase M20 [Amylocystis lapponica]
MARIYRNPTAASYTTPASACPDDSHVFAFHQALPGYARTPLHPLPTLAQRLNVRHVLVKDESSRLGLPAFKILGASWATSRALARHLALPRDSADSLSALAAAAEGKDITLFAATDGNHGRAVARVARLLGVGAEVYVPAVMDGTTRALIAQEGARVVQVDGDYDLAVREVWMKAGAVQGGILIEDTAFEGYEETAQWIVDGYSTMFAELDEQIAGATGGKGADVVIVPAGVGSLAQAAVVHFKQPGCTTKIVSVEPDTAACLRKALREHADSPVPPESIPTSNTIMAGLNCGTVSSLAWPLLRHGIDVATSVADIQTHRAVEELREANIAVGPCGAAPLAALHEIATQAPDILHPDAVVVLLATEGPRPYAVPHDSTTTDAVALTQILTRINSSNPDLSGGAGETEIADYLSAWLEHHAFEVHRLEQHPGRPSIVGLARGRGEGPSLMFNGHIDTVTLAGFSGNPLSGALVDGKMHGRGTFDMKAGVAASLVAAHRARGAGLRGDVLLALVADEENLSLGTREVLEAGWRADAAVVSEPTAHALMLAHKGFVWAVVEVRGRAGHGSRPDLCVDAIVKAGHFLVALEAHGEALVRGDAPGSVRHPKLGTGTVHAGLIKGGEEVSSYPALCTIHVERRTVPGETPASVEVQFRAILDELVQRVPDFKYELRMGDSRVPYEVDPEHPFVRLFAGHAEAVLGEEPQVEAGTYWTDCALLAEKGIPAVLFGVQGEGAHAAKEWATVESIGQDTETLTRVAVDFCG